MSEGLVPAKDVIADIMARMEKESHDRETIALANREIVFPKLKELGINEVIVKYEGSGDSGDFQRPYDPSTKIDQYGWVSDEEYQKTPFAIEKVTIVQFGSSFDHEQGKWISEGKEVEMTLGEAIRDIAYDLLEAKHGGWENNDGADGYFTINVEKETIELEHNEYERTSHTHNYGWEKDDH